MHPIGSRDEQNLIAKSGLLQLCKVSMQDQSWAPSTKVSCLNQVSQLEIKDAHCELIPQGIVIIMKDLCLGQNIGIIMYELNDHNILYKGIQGFKIFSH